MILNFLYIQYYVMHEWLAQKGLISAVLELAHSSKCAYPRLTLSS